jgi:hypothetical protein
MSGDPNSLGEMFEAGLKKVLPTFLTGIVLVVGVLWAWPDPTTTSKDYAPTDVGLLALRPLADGGRASSTELELRAGDRVTLAAHVPFMGTAKVYRLEGEAGERLWPVDSDAAERTSAGRSVELGEVAVTGDGGVQTWLLSLCPLDAPAPACVVREHKPLCPEGCLTATMRARVLP